MKRSYILRREFNLASTVDWVLTHTYRKKYWICF